MNKLMNKINETALRGLFLCEDFFKNLKNDEEGAGVIEYIIIVIIAIVIGALVLTFFKDELNNTILPKVKDTILDLFS